MRNIYTSPLSLKKKKVHIFLHFFFVLFNKVFFNPSLFFHFFLSSSFPSFLQKKGAHTKKKSAGVLCREE